MRVVFLCLLHAVFHATFGTGDSLYSWGNGRQGQSEDDNNLEVCVAGQYGCGCCLMKTKLDRMRNFLNRTAGGMSKYLNKSKAVVNDRTESRSAFSVSLNNDTNLTCLGPFTTSSLIAYKHVFLNLGNDYNADNGTFKASHSGVYSIAATIYGTNSTGLKNNTCASLRVNDVETKLQEKYAEDPEDSNTVVIAVKLKVGDEVSVLLNEGCIICDDKNHYNTFTGFLVYPTD